MFCSKDHLHVAFQSGLVHPVVVRLDLPSSGCTKREIKSRNLCTLLCGGDEGNAIQGISRGDPNLFTGLASMRSGFAGGSNTPEDAANGDEEDKKSDVLETASNWPAIVPLPPEPAPRATDDHMPPGILSKTRVEDTYEMGRVLRAAVDMEVGEVALREMPLLVWPTGVSSQVEYYNGVLDAYLAAPASARAAVDDLCHPCPLDHRGETGRRYRAYAYILWQLRTKGWRSDGQKGDVGAGLALTASKIWRLIASIDCNAIGYGSERCAVFARCHKPTQHAPLLSNGVV